ncbi:MAG: bacteriophage Gp15 family protein [Ruminococcus flavefaciens]|nr:bacteriophage Gp15 family protein [Ruminococcus flavefaciens]
MIGYLPETLTVGGTEYPIRTDYRDVLQVYEAFNDPELETGEAWIVAIYLLFEDFSCADDVEEAVRHGFDLEEAAGQVSWFLSVGRSVRKDTEKPVYSWVQDEQMIFAAVNAVAGKEVRDEAYMHWWTFSGWMGEVREDTWTHIVGIRDKLNRGKKLESSEREYYARNRDVIEIRAPKSREEQRKEAEYNAYLEKYLG